MVKIISFVHVNLVCIADSTKFLYIMCEKISLKITGFVYIYKKKGSNVNG